MSETIDELVREAEILKSKLEKERDKFNDIECRKNNQNEIVELLFLISVLLLN